MKAFVDSREPDDIKLKMAKGNANGNITYNTKELPQGDFYLPEHDVVIERKEASDFASSTTEGRLSKQADRMIAQHDHAFVIIENDIWSLGGPPNEPFSLYNLQYSDIGYKSIVGMQTSLAVKRGIKIIYTESVEQTIYAVNRIFERFADEEHKEADSGYVKTHDTGEVDDVQVAMLAQVQGVSPSKAKDIMSYCRRLNFSFADLIAGNVELQEIDGIGPTLAQRVVDSFQ